ncbi:pentapeptide repeat-containing protein [Roseateles sp. BYS96W]|uniref:Pentapeptide repeat-containing protein n=1 Tax=Pelomonas nitida TaxID=3299027 RepID=A0ABW7G4G0_9BURK
MTNPLMSRWGDEEIYRFILSNVVLSKVEPDGMSWREWFDSTAPRTPHYKTGEAILDCRFVNIDGYRFPEQWLNYVLDNGSARACLFFRTGLQEASAVQVDFSRSRFVMAQMSPFFAAGANFSFCTFLDSFATGHGSRDPDTGVWSYSHALSDFSKCNLSQVVARSTYFDRCDFRGANFSGAIFNDCHFNFSDLRDVNLEGSEFTNCNFDRASLTDNILNRRVVEFFGQNKNLDQIRWEPAGLSEGT